MARKDQLSSKQDSCDICGTALDEDAVIQEFPDGSVVKLCADCSAGAPPEDEIEADDDDQDLGDATEEWSDATAEHPPVKEPPRREPPGFDLEDFDDDEYQPGQPAAPGALDMEEPGDSVARAAAELAAWASAPSDEEPVLEDEADVPEDFDEEEAEEAARELVAAIVEADMADDTARFTAVAGAEEPAAEFAEEDEAGAYEGPTDYARAEITPDAETEAELALDAPSDTANVVTDLLSLQTEMQSALARLSSTLEHFVSDMVTSEEKTSAMSGRLQELEEELESTRERLQAAEALLPDSAIHAVAGLAAATAASESELLGAEGAAGAPGGAVAPPPPLPTLPAAVLPAVLPAVAGFPPPLPGMPTAGTAPLVPPPFGAAPPATAAAPPPLPPMGAGMPLSAPPLDDEHDLDDEDDLFELSDLTPTPRTAKPAATPPAPTAAAAASAAGAAPPMPAPGLPLPHAVAGAAAAMQKLLRGRKGHQAPIIEPEPEPELEPEPEDEPGLTFSINEVQVAQRYFNESEFVKKIKEISRSIGKPKANVSRTLPGAPEASITVFWDIVWYQYLVDLRKELPAGGDRVVLDREGMDLEELQPRFRDKNATINDDGRLDASELEVNLLSDPAALITEMEMERDRERGVEVSSPETRLAEDATEEIWDQQSAPEFRWD